MAECPIWIGDPALGMVDIAYEKYSAFASQSFQIAMEGLQALGTFQINGVNTSNSYNASMSLAEYRRPTKPTSAQIDLSLPALPEFNVPDETLREPPVDTSQIPVLSIPPPPSQSLPTAPGNAPPLTPLTLPAEPSLIFPTVPDLVDITIPTAPTISLPTFAGVRPDDTDLVAPVENFGFTAQQYTSALLDKVRGRVSSMLDGDTGLPAAIAQALRDRAFAAVDREEYRAVQTATEEFASRGFSEPNGILTRRLAEVRQNSQSQRNAASRDIHIRDQEIAVENLRFAVTQGIALESALIQDWHEYMRLGLAVAQAVQQFAIDVFNAKVTLFNARYQAYVAEAQVFEQLLRAELAKLEVFKAEIDAERLKGEINQQKVALYEQRVRALLVQVQVYQGQIEAVKAQAEVNTSIMESYRAQVAAYSERVKATAVVWDGYRSLVDAELSKVRIYEVSENAYATRVRAWAETEQAKTARRASNIDLERLRLERWKGELEASLSDVRNRLAVAAQSVEVYRAEAGVEGVASEANNRKFTLMMEQERARTEVSLKDAELRIQQALKLTEITIQKLVSIAQISGTVTASAMGAVNFSAGVSSGHTQTQACDTNFSYSGKL